MNVYDLLPDFKVVEINNSVALRSGHMIAQSPLAKAGFVTDADYVENGYVLYLDVDGYLKTPGNASADVVAAGVPFLHYTEEIFTTGLTQELNKFAVEWNDDDECYPRALALYVGDAFTTNNYSGTLSTATVAILDDNGAFVLYATLAAAKTGDATYVGPLFHVEPTTLPDGETDGAELTVLSTVVSFA